MFPFITVVVVAYKAEGEIVDCLNSLLGQSYPKDKYEILVVVDDKETYNVIKNYPINICHRKVKGNIPSARNAGIKLSKAEIIAYTDSDCVVPTNWLGVISKSFNQYPKISGVGGIIKPHDTDPISRSLSILNMVGNSTGNFSFNQQFPTSNSAFKKEVLSSIGGFDEHAQVGEDRDLYVRLKKNNYQLLFNPDLIVCHKHRNKIITVFKWCYSVKKRSTYISKKYWSFKSILRQIMPAVISLLLIVLSFFLVYTGVLYAILMLLTISLLIYFFTYLFYRNHKYFNSKTFLIFPFVVLTISSGFLFGYIAALLNQLMNH